MNEPTVADAIEEPKAVKAVKQKMYKVTIHSGEDKGDKGDVFLGHNGKSYLIQRDNEAIVPECIIDVLSHTVIETTVKDESGNERIVKIPRFAYNVSPA